MMGRIVSQWPGIEEIFTVVLNRVELGRGLNEFELMVCDNPWFLRIAKLNNRLLKFKESLENL